ncbi:hypothetical protein AOL_s00110g102 [Orbilia oligospora ATCC 24927]|uniref:histidine kinase n=3 Tax=Orbilia oligospora TaxID=2813651 RepID=G1XKT2_ARTOA|nr:hypothetical protein AOL_s00110g102 [Orbilia oligospora ATCC 24927]EGX46278.1 hypothetical protein AOL_s00110g102 [Orbilia oligospora ATCC 24927]KAF3281168.1 hypothetical protein TWF970_002336 [Orbilia oligospora]
MSSPLTPIDDEPTTPRLDGVDERPSILGITEVKVKNTVPERPSEPTIFDATLTSSPIFEFCEGDFQRLYPADRDEDGCVTEPIKPVDFEDPYLFPTLTKNELIRLKSLWYYGRYIENDTYLLSCLQDQVDLVNDFMEKDCVILGLLDHDYYRRVVTANVPLAILPRREATCAHTVLHDGGRVFMVKDMEKDWRFMASPHVEAGLKFYAGTQLRYKIPGTNCEIAFGSLCVANFSATQPLSLRQQNALMKFADIIVHTIIERTRSMRLAERERLTSILGHLTKTAEPKTIRETALQTLRETYPFASVSIQSHHDDYLSLKNRHLPISYSDFRENIWEDDEGLNNWIAGHNNIPYKRSECDPSVRAIAVRMKSDPKSYVVVETSQMKQIFDEVDSWFVGAVTLLVCNTIQEELLNQTMDAKSRFLRGISHELRTPIHAILSSCELLIEENRGITPPTNSQEHVDSLMLPRQAYLSDKALAMLSNIDSSGRELLNTINNLLDYDQFENKAIVKVMQLHSFNIIEEEVLRETASGFNTDQAVTLISDNRLPPEVEMLMTDYNLIKQCLGQLVQNAMKFTNTGTVIFQTTLSEHHDILEYNIVDTGIGIADEDREKIFQPFEKVDPTVRGSGLGLPVASRIAEVLGGSLKLISSCPSDGSHFRLQLENPILACPRLSYRKRILINCEMPLTYFMPIDRQLETVHLTYAARNLERMGFRCNGPDKATVVLVEAKSATDTFANLLGSIRRDQIIIYICQNYSELRDSEEALSNEDYTRRFIRCLTPVRRGRLWQVVEDAVNAYRDLGLKDPKLHLPEPSKHFLEGPSKVRSGQNIHATAISTESSKTRRRHHGRRRLDALRILIVDDNPTNLGILVMYCKRRKHDYVTAVNGKEAHQKYLEAAAEDKCISLVLMDLDMPVKNGIDATHDIRVSEATEGLQPSMVFMVTGQNTDEDKEKSVAAGANGYYVKPLSMKALDDLISLHFPQE